MLKTFMIIPAGPHRHRPILRVLGCVCLCVAGSWAGTTQSRPRAGSRAAQAQKAIRSADRGGLCRIGACAVIGGVALTGGVATYLGTPAGLVPASAAPTTPPVPWVLIPEPDFAREIKELAALSQTLDRLLGQAELPAEAGSPAPELELELELEPVGVGDFSKALDVTGHKLEQMAMEDMARLPDRGSADPEDLRVARAVKDMNALLRSLIKKARLSHDSADPARVHGILVMIEKWFVQTYFKPDPPMRETSRVWLAQALAKVDLVRNDLSLPQRLPPVPSRPPRPFPDEDPRS